MKKVVCILIVFSFLLYSPLNIISMKPSTYDAKIYSLEASLTKKDTLYGALYYEDADAYYAELTELVINLYIPILTEKFSIEEPVFFDVYIYNQEESMKAALGIEGAAPMGAYRGGVLHVLSPSLWIDAQNPEIVEQFFSRGPVVHELVHLMVDIKTGGNYPPWLTEGVALYFENKYTGFSWRDDLQTLSSQITIEELVHDFRDLDVSLAYRRSFDEVKLLVASYGEDGLVQILHDLGKGYSFEKAVMLQQQFR